MDSSSFCLTNTTSGDACQRHPVPSPGFWVLWAASGRLHPARPQPSCSPRSGAREGQQHLHKSLSWALCWDHWSLRSHSSVRFSHMFEIFFQGKSSKKWWSGKIIHISLFSFIHYACVHFTHPFASFSRFGVWIEGPVGRRQLLNICRRKQTGPDAKPLGCYFQTVLLLPSSGSELCSTKSLLPPTCHYINLN